MMNSWLMPHQALLTYSIAQQKLPHAILISGVDGVGKAALATWLVSVLSCQQRQLVDEILMPCGQCKACNLTANQSHPDHLLLPLKTNTIGVEQIRQVSRFFEKTALLAHFQTAVIEQADKMTESAANALLKTLEEPTANSVIILLTADVERLLPTITSRCRHIAIRATNAQLTQQPTNFEPINNAFTNVTHQAQHTDRQTQEAFTAFTQAFIDFLAQCNSRSLLLSLMNDNPNTLKWLEQISANLLRNQANWLTLQNDSTLDSDSLNFITQLTHDDLWQIQQLIVTTSKTLLTKAQANSQYQYEKLLIDIAQYMQQRANTLIG